MLGTELNDDRIDTIKIRVNNWQKLMLSRYSKKLWIDKACRGAPIYPFKQDNAKKTNGI